VNDENGRGIDTHLTESIRWTLFMSTKWTLFVWLLFILVSLPALAVALRVALWIMEVGR